MNINELTIGKQVGVKLSSYLSYEETDDRTLIRMLFKAAAPSAQAIVTGIVHRYVGTFYPACRGGFDEDFEPASLGKRQRVVLVELRAHIKSKPFYATIEDLFDVQ